LLVMPMLSEFMFVQKSMFEYFFLRSPHSRLMI
jgi:hypothetical protein